MKYASVFVLCVVPSICRCDSRWNAISTLFIVLKSSIWRQRNSIERYSCVEIYQMHNTLVLHSLTLSENQLADMNFTNNNDKSFPLFLLDLALKFSHKYSKWISIRCCCNYHTIQFTPRLGTCTNSAPTSSNMPQRNFPFQKQDKLETFYST